METETLISICLGIGLAASVGFRVFVPLFILSLCGYYNIWHLNENWQWLGSFSAVIILGIATIMEILGYLIPFVDNLLDTIAVPLAAIAGTLVMVSTLADISPVFTWTLAIIAGGGTAAAIAGTTSLTRTGSSATTAGLANPVVSSIETGTSVIMAIMSVFFPVLAIVFVFVLLYFIFKLYKKFRSGRG